MRIITAGLTFDEERHLYFLDRVPIPGCTSILKAAGYVDDRWFTEASRDRGSAVHIATWLDDEGDLDESSVPETARGGLEAWRKCKRETGIEPLILPDGGIAAEIAVASRIFRFATTVDRVMLVRGIPSVFELKTGEPTDAAKLQTAAHALALYENGIPVAQRFAVRLKSDGNYSITKHEDYVNDMQDFLAGLRCARRQRKLEEG